MTTILLTIQIILAVILVIVVLLQKSSSIGLGAYSGSNDSVFGAKGPASFMAKLTMILGVLFLINTVALGYYYNKGATKSVVDNMATPAPLQHQTLIPTLPSASSSTSDLANPLANPSASPLANPATKNTKE
ncbi:preprotein translocase subunit SecG [Helicobacter sp. 11S02629-2]|nr:preprotein translocase subunit SecG [Helicobacter sp. 11S02629-2]